MTWYHVLLGLTVAVLTFATLQLTGVDRAAWADPARRLAYIALGVFGVALALGSAFGENAKPLSAMAVGWGVGLAVGGVRAARSTRVTATDRPGCARLGITSGDDGQIEALIAMCDGHVDSVIVYGGAEPTKRRWAPGILPSPSLIQRPSVARARSRAKDRVEYASYAGSADIVRCHGFTTRLDHGLHRGLATTLKVVN